MNQHFWPRWNPASIIAFGGLALLGAIGGSAQATPALAWNEPDSVQGVKWGATISEARESVKPSELICPDSATCVSSAPTTIGSVPMRLRLSFDRDRFVAAVLVAKSTKFAELRALFIERYGPPTQRTRLDFVAADGQRAMNDRVTWLGPRLRIDLWRYSDALDSSQAKLELR